MKPSELSNDKLANCVARWCGYLAVARGYNVEDLAEVETRLRDSIPKPVVEVEHDQTGCVMVFLNGQCIDVYMNEEDAIRKLRALEVALGITE